MRVKQNLSASCIPLFLTNKNQTKLEWCECVIYKMLFMESVLADCPHQDCIECSFRCVSKDVAMTACGAHIDILGEQLQHCLYCKRMSEPATQDFEDYELSMYLDECPLDDAAIFGETEVKVNAEEDEERQEFMSTLDTWMDKMDRDAAAYTTMSPESQRRVDGVTFTYFKPFASRIRPEERKEFKEFVTIIF